MLFGAEGLHGIDGGGATGGQVACEERGGYEPGGDGGIGERVGGFDLEEQRGHEPHDDDGDRDSADHTDAGQE